MCSEDTILDAGRVKTILTSFVNLRIFSLGLTDCSAGHGGEDPQGGRGPFISYQGICLITRPSKIPLALFFLPRLMALTGQGMDAV